MVLTLSEAAEAARNANWASTTVSIGILVQHFGPEPILYHFNRNGDVVGFEKDGIVTAWRA